jgi:A/G-specific adenine glycosylase
LASGCSSFQAGDPTEYPHRKILPPKALKQITVLICLYKKEILLEQQPETGIWGGLWSLPTTLPSGCTVIQHLPDMQHTFTHFKLTLHPRLCQATRRPKLKNHRWVPLESALDTYGVPAPIKRIVKIIQIKQHQHRV